LLARANCQLFENFATEIRELQNPKLAKSPNPSVLRTGCSSTMPHKRNPEICEAHLRLGPNNQKPYPSRDGKHCNLAREDLLSLRLSASSSRSLHIVDYLLDLNDECDCQPPCKRARMLENTQLTQDRAMSEAVMMALVQKGPTARRHMGCSGN